MTQVTLKEKKTAVRLPRGAKAPARRVKSRARELGASVPAGDTDTDTDTGNAGAGAARVQRKKKKRAKNTNAADPGSKHASAFPRTASVERQLSDAPAWNYANTYLLRGFRPASGCVKSSLLSIFEFHNETVNIWIHLVGALGFALAVPYAGTLLGPGTSGTDLACFVTFLCAATLCLGVSGLYHALANHSEEMHDTLLSWDLRCITLLIGSCYLPVMTNAFHCHPALCALFVSLVGVLVTAVLVVSAPGPAGRSFAAPGAKWLRLGVYGSLGGFGVVPIATAVWVRGWGAATQEQVSEVLMVYALFGLGGLIQVTRFPEVVSRLAGVGRVWRGRFDMIGASHQLWHAFVVAGTVRHAMLCIQVHRRRVAEGCAAGEM